MTDAVLDIGLQAILLAAKIAAPILITALVVGFLIGLLQSVTQVQEITLSFVPKAIAVLLVLLLFGDWMIGEIITFSENLFEQIPSILQSS